MLWDYYRGALAPGLGLAVSTHLELCSHCRSDLRLFDAVGGALLDDIEGVELSESALDLALARIERPDDSNTKKPAKTVKHPAFLAEFDLPEVLQSADIRGRYWAAPGVWIAPVYVDDAPKDSKTFLMYVRKGMVMPEHTHRGREITMMLKGKFSDSKGSYAPGDFAVCDESDCHSPAMSDEEDCMCFVAQEGSIVPKTLLGKLLQPFARI